MIIVFDGFCVLCNKYVVWVFKRNPSKNIYFTNFNSVFIKEKYPNLKLGNTVFVIKNNGEILTKSQAIKHCIKYLEINLIFKYMLFFTPNFFLNFLYDLIARNRYNIFGKYNECTIPNSIESSNILN
ncbi:MAG: hypothetical protein CND26_00660 [Bacteroidetes bacterium MED-G13]|nr:hypothetical protein [Flavobacteriaceae bacterium]PDH47969.1 MAG: hypothetical protein CND26_00660 [Bacteroidetes bacterium MED-G13]|tara:strand:- start:74 stop:454 length:381 start_codon:yes stop_codon:yes gene_type:complete